MASQAKLEDSNIAAYGSKAHKDVKLAAARTAPEWKGAGARCGTQIWRVEKLKIKQWPKEQYGKFYDGDAYIVLHTYKQGDSDRLLYNIHFWLGAESSQDEQGVAAYKTVELDDLLGDVPVQHREVQGSESEEFLALFKNKITLLHGGIESGFRHVKPEEYKPRLFHLKGKREIRVTEVKLDLKSLNDGDVFVLDAGLELYVWNGRTAGAYERKQARDTTQELREERNGRPKIKILDGLEDDEKFWKLLGGAKPKPGDIAPATSDDVKIEHTNVLMRLSDSSGELKFTEISKGDAKKSDFKSEDVFIYDIGHTVFAWIGKGASKAERANGIKYAETYIKNHSRPAHTPILRILEGVEPVSFNRNVK